MRFLHGMLLLAALMAAPFAPGPSMAEPVGPPQIEVYGVTLDRIQAESGEFATGEHKFLANLTNVGSSSFNHDIRIDAKAINQNKTFLEMSSRNDTAYLIPGETVQIESAAIRFPRGVFDLTIKVIFGGTTIEATSTVVVLDIIDLSIGDISLEPNERIKAGSSVDIDFDVSFFGNVGPWAADVRADLVISNGTGTEFTSEIEVMDSERKPIDPPHIFRDLSFDTWRPYRPGEYVAYISMSYRDDDPQNNHVSIPITVFVVPSISGNVTSNGEAVPDAMVVLYRNGVPVWANRTDGKGHFEIYGLGSGIYSLNVSHQWASSVQFDVKVVAWMTSNVSVGLEYLNIGDLEGIVTVLPGGNPAPGAMITIWKRVPILMRIGTVFTNEDGYFTFTSLGADDYTIRAEHPCYGSENRTATVLPRTTVNMTIGIQIVKFSVVDLDPMNGTMDFPLGGNVTVRFSRSIDTRTVSNITLVDTDLTEPVPVAYECSEDGTIVTIDPISSLDPVSIYAMVVSPMLKAMVGDTIGIEVWSFFATGEDPYRVSVTTEPQDGEEGVGIRERIVVTFSDMMDPDTIHSGTFKVLDDMVEIQGTIEVSRDGRRATFIPLEPFKLDTIYQVILTEYMVPVDTLAVFRGHTFTFRTMDSSAPGSVKGRLMDPDGNPLSGHGVEVRFLRAGQEVSAHVDDGGWFMEDIPSGTWRMEIKCPGYELLTRSVEVRPGETTDVGNLKPSEGTDGSIGVMACIIPLIVIIIIVTIVALKMKKGREVIESKSEAPPTPQVPQWKSPSDLLDLVPEEPAIEAEEGSIDEADEEPLTEELEIRTTLRSVDNTLCVEVTRDSVDTSRLDIEIDGTPLQSVPGTLNPSEEYRVGTGFEIMPGDEYFISVALDGRNVFGRMVTADP